LPWPELLWRIAQAGRPNSAVHDTHAGRILQGIGTFIGIERDNQKTLTYAADEKAWLLNTNTPHLAFERLSFHLFMSSFSCIKISSSLFFL
jgi:hypothetical protein